ncbi:MAG: radical SAM protein [Candidatus Bathyarchaeia archaeon]
MYDAVSRHKAIENFVLKIENSAFKRKYWRFRADRWYGGIATADCVGCGLLCKFCWVRDDIMYRPFKVGEFYSHEEISKRLLSIAKEHGFTQLRVSGGEPTIGKAHLINLLEALDSEKLTFILETNGILLGNDRAYAKELSRFRILHVRISLKGCNENDFSRLTGANPEGFFLQLKSLENLVDEKVSCHPSVMISFSSKESLNSLIEKLNKIDKRLAKSLEIEELILYPHVVRKIERFGLKYKTGYSPGEIPKDFI